MSKMYMDGIGIMARTHELNRLLWKAVDDAIIGTTAAVFAIILGAFGAYHYLDNAAAMIGILAWAFLTIYVGIFMTLPWFEAEDNLKAHTDAIRYEIDQHGRGWARS